MFKLPSNTKQTNGSSIKSILGGASYRIMDATNRCYIIEVVITKLDGFSLVVREQENGHYAIGYSKDLKAWHIIKDDTIDNLRKLNKKKEVKKGLEINQLCRKIKSKMIALSKESFETPPVKK